MATQVGTFGRRASNVVSLDEHRIKMLKDVARNGRELLEEVGLKFSFSLASALRVDPFNTLAESFSALELLALVAGKTFKSKSHIGCGKSVVEVPGLGGGDWEFPLMSKYLRRHEFIPIEADIKFNAISPRFSRKAILEAVKYGFRVSGGQKVAIAGHSLGFLQGLDVAGDYPHLVDRVVGLGGPVLHKDNLPIAMSTSVKTVIHLAMLILADEKGVLEFVKRNIEIATSSNVPIIAVVATGDGIVDPKKCSLPGGPHIDIPGTHIGLTVNRRLLAILPYLLVGDTQKVQNMAVYN